MTAPRVAFLIDTLGAGGTERSLAESLPHLLAAGIEARVFVLRHSEPGFAGLVCAAGVEVEPLPSTGWPRRVRALRRHLLAWRPLLLHTALFTSDQIGRLAAAGTGIPVVSSLVNSRYEPERLDDPRISPWRFEVVRHLDGWTGRRLVTHFHAVSEAAKRSAVEHLGLPAGRVTVVHRGRDDRHLGGPSAERRRRARSRWRLADDELLIVNVGRQTFQKAQLVLLRALRRLLAAGRRARLIVAGGEGPATPELSGYLARHRLHPAALLAGHVEDVPELLAAADLFAFPSRLEGFPGALLEALGMGVPVVASDIEPVREIFPDRRRAVLVRRESADELAAELARLADDPARRAELAAAGRALFLERFEIRRTVPAMIDLYQRVARDAYGGGRA